MQVFNVGYITDHSTIITDGATVDGSTVDRWGLVEATSKHGAPRPTHGQILHQTLALIQILAPP